MTNPKPMVLKLLPRHTEAGISMSYDDDCVTLRRHGLVLTRTNSKGTRTVAVWTGCVTFEQLVEEADHYIQ